MSTSMRVFKVPDCWLWEQLYWLSLPSGRNKLLLQFSSSTLCSYIIWIRLIDATELALCDFCQINSHGSSHVYHILLQTTKVNKEESSIFDGPTPTSKKKDPPEEGALHQEETEPRKQGSHLRGLPTIWQTHVHIRWMKYTHILVTFAWTHQTTSL